MANTAVVTERETILNTPVMETRVGEWHAIHFRGDGYLSLHQPGGQCQVVALTDLDDLLTALTAMRDALVPSRKTQAAARLLDAAIALGDARAAEGDRDDIEAAVRAHHQAYLAWRIVA